MQFAKLADLQRGQVVWLDGGFTCHPPGRTVIQCDPATNELFFYCCRGEHFLDGQLDDRLVHVVGVWDREPENSADIKWEQVHACPCL